MPRHNVRQNKRLERCERPLDETGGTTEMVLKDTYSHNTKKPVMFIESRFPYIKKCGTPKSNDF